MLRPTSFEEPFAHGQITKGFLKHGRNHKWRNAQVQYVQNIEKKLASLRRNSSGLRAEVVIQLNRSSFYAENLSDIALKISEILKVVRSGSVTEALI